MGPGLPVGVRTVDPTLASLQSACNDFIQPHSVEQQGVTGVDVALPTLIPLRNPKAHWEALIKGAGCFWFSLLSLYIFNSQITLLKLGLFFTSGDVWLNGAGRVQRSFAIPKKRYSLPTMVQAKHTVFAHHPRSVPFCYYLAWYKAEQRRERRGYLANEKQLGQVPDSSQACELNKAHCIDLRVIHYLFWM